MREAPSGMGWVGLELWVGLGWNFGLGWNSELELWELWKISKILDFCDLLGTSGWNFGVGTGKFHSTQSSNPKFATVPEVPKVPQSSPKVSKVS